MRPVAPITSMVKNKKFDKDRLVCGSQIEVQEYDRVNRETRTVSGEISEVQARGVIVHLDRQVCQPRHGGGVEYYRPGDPYFLDYSTIVSVDDEKDESFGLSPR